MKRPAIFLYINLLIIIFAFVASCGNGSSPVETASTPEKGNFSAMSSTAQKSVTSSGFKITGRIKYGAEGLYGAQVDLTGDISAKALTNSSGEFSFDGLPNGRYTLTPSKTGFTFNALNAVATVDNADISSMIFVASAYEETGHSLSGSITSDNAPLTGVSIKLGGAASAVLNNNIDATAGYAIEGLADGTYSLTPSKPGYVFFPASVAVFVKGRDISGIDFAGAPVSTPTYKLSGRVSFGSVGLNGAIIRLRGPVNGATVTDRGGNFSIPYLPDADYAISASMSGYVFTPEERRISIKGSDVAGADFNASGAGYTVSGRVHYPQCPECIVQGVTVTLNTDPPVSSITGIDGLYNFKNLPSGVYTVTPDKSGVQSVFLPASKAVHVDYENVVDADFAVNKAYSVAGLISYAGAKTGRVYAGLYYSDTNEAAYSGTSVAGPGPFSVRGVSPGNYRLCAWMDTLGMGRRNIVGP
ncbi:MAG: carboxypeptidase regulatory-like domain-containing protein, partial [Nitrospirota bacterium]|nr:carboxypeptidase regulatory-like domain-containing protein [Nitrospirota bacterium]